MLDPAVAKATPWARLARGLAQCWTVPGATPALAAEYRGRQFQAVMRQLPLASLGNVVSTLTIVIVFWHRAAHEALVAWSLLQTLIATGNTLFAVHHTQRHQNARATSRTLWLLAADLGVSALLYSAMALYLFRSSDEYGHLIVTAIVAAFIGTGSWLFAAVPQAGLAWSLTLCLVTALGLLAQKDHPYGFIAALLPYYAIVMVASVLTTSRAFLAGLKAETELERQRQLVDLLLNDFEESASDWLWETDCAGSLTHVSARMGEAIGIEPSRLQGRPLVAVIAAGFDQAPPAEAAMLELFRERLAGDGPFRDVVIPVRVGQQPRWWSMTAKPLHDAAGSVQGWRGVGSDITAVRERESEIIRLANVDMLTGLANRHQFSNHLESFFADPRAVLPCTLFLLDLDNFKTVNDSLGHAAGDLLLQEVARRLGTTLTEGELLARLGGDEFALVVPGALTREHAEDAGKRLLAALAQPWTVQGHQLKIRASLGIGFAPLNAQTAPGLLKISDLALYAAKAAGRHTLRFYEPHMDAHSQHKLGILNDLGDGLARDEFRLQYQPQIDLATGAVAGFEALVRWRHPVKGFIAPEDFIAVAEESGLIMPLGNWVLRQACADAVRWPKHIKVAVNVSKAQFANSDVQEVVRTALAQSGLAPDRLEVELTEATLMEETNLPLEVLHGLKQIGVGIVLDDFGTGYSSLSYLRRFPLDKIKIDRSTVSALDQGEADAVAIVRAIVQLAQALHLKTTAEGVETLVQREVLRGIGCTQMQGHIVAKALDCDEAEEFMEAWSLAVA